MCVYIYIYVYHIIFALGGNHLSNATCLTQVLFKCDECGNLW